MVKATPSIYLERLSEQNSVDDRSVQGGGKPRICTIDGYAMLLTCRGGLMYLSVLGTPTDKDLERYQAVHLTGPHEWDFLSWTSPTYLVMGSLFCPITLMRDLPLILILMNLGITHKGQFKLSIYNILDGSSPTLTTCSTIITNQHVISSNQHVGNNEAPDYDIDTVKETMEQSTQW